MCSNLLELPPSRLDEKLAGPPFYLPNGFRHLKRVQLPCPFILVPSFEDIPIAGSVRPVCNRPSVGLYFVDESSKCSEAHFARGVLLEVLRSHTRRVEYRVNH